MIPWSHHDPSHPQVLEHLRFRGLSLSPPLYEEAVAACAAAHQTAEARRLVGKMIAAGYEPSECLGAAMGQGLGA